MSWPETTKALAEAVFARDVRKSLGIDFSGFFYGELKIQLSASWDPKTYTALKRPGVAEIHISYQTCLQAAGYDPSDRFTGSKADKAAKLLKRAMLGLGYHEIGHLKLTDMSGEEFAKLLERLNQMPDEEFKKRFKSLTKQDIEELVQYVQEFCNIVEDPTQEHMLGNLPYYTFVRKYFKWLVERLFVPAAKSYKDDGSLRSFMNYLLLFARLGGGRIADRNAKFDNLAKKGFVKKLRAAARETDGIKRCAMQIDMALWVVEELGLKPDQLQSVAGMTPSRPVIILVDPTTKRRGTKTKKQHPITGALPLVSVVEASDEGDAGNQPESQIDADIVDMRKNKKPQNEQSFNQSGGGTSSSEQQTEQGEENGKTSKTGAQASEAENDVEGKGSGEQQSQNQHQAGNGRGTSSADSSEEDSILAIGGNDPLQVGTDDFNDELDEYDPDLEAAKSMGASVPRYADDEFVVRSEHALQDRYQNALLQYSAGICDLSQALTEMRAESAPKVYRYLDEGDDIDVEAYIEASQSPYPSMDWFKEERKGKSVTDLAVSMLVDCSGSMGYGSDACAYATAAMVVAACEDAQIPTEISAFSSYDVLYVKRFDEDSSVAPIRLGLLEHSQWKHYHKEGQLNMWGGTDLFSALQVVLSKLETRTDNAFKVLFIITDGDTGNRDRVRKLVAHAKDEHILVVAIGIGQSLKSLSECFGECAAFSPQSLGSLPVYVSNVLKEALASRDLWLNK